MRYHLNVKSIDSLVKLVELILEPVLHSLFIAAKLIILFEISVFQVSL